MAVAVENGEGARVGGAVGGLCCDSEPREGLLTQHHFGFDHGSEVVERDGAGVWVVGFGENKGFAGAVEDMQRYIHGGGGGLHGYSLDGGGKHEVAEAQCDFSCHAAKVYGSGCLEKDSRGAECSAESHFIYAVAVFGA